MSRHHHNPPRDARLLQGPALVPLLFLFPWSECEHACAARDKFGFMSVHVCVLYACVRVHCTVCVPAVRHCLQEECVMGISAFSEASRGFTTDLFQVCVRVCFTSVVCVWPLKKTYKFGRTTSQSQRTAAINVTKWWHRLRQLEEPFHSFSSLMAWLEETVKMDKKVNHLGFIGKHHPLSCGAVKGKKKKSWKRITAAGRYYWADAARWRCGVMGWRWC